ncbi:hypothetical protein [Ruminococcus flavefaciens]|uniref:hypothetical protein n=1 Tax=Ruminococcus flavefaciens TaxID=1265 RepID=UPI00048F9301|nr:hypothetical protein [Ruminococcus flavefaciens]
MKNGPMIALAVFLVLLVLGHTVKLVFQVIKGRLLLSRARKSGEPVIKGVNAVYKMINYIVAVVTEALFTGFIGWNILKYKMDIISAVLIWTTVLSLGLSTVIHIIALFTEKNVYLTPSGLIYFLGRFKFADCRFSWDSSDTPDSLSDKLYIYEKKAKFPFVASFEDRENAHRIVNENSVKQQ